MQEHYTAEDHRSVRPLLMGHSDWGGKELVYTMVIGVGKAIFECHE